MLFSILLLIWKVVYNSKQGLWKNILAYLSLIIIIIIIYLQSDCNNYRFIYAS